MSDFDIPRNLNFARACAPFSQRGGFPLSDLLPIIPPGAKLGSKSAVDRYQSETDSTLSVSLISYRKLLANGAA